MKKLLLFAALVLGMASCQTEPEGLDVVVGGEQEVMLNVSLPESTRMASSAGFNFNDFDSNSQYDLRFILEIAHNGKVVRTVKTSNTTTVTFPVRLAPDREYTFTVWADLVLENTDAADLYYNILSQNKADDESVLNNITFNTNYWAPNVEARDAYTFTTTKEFKAGETNLTMNLTRPFAKVRVVATDIENVTKFDIVPDNAVVTYNVDLYTSFNAVTGVAGDAEATAFEYTINPEAYEEETGKLTVFADYIFVPADGTVKFDLEIKDGDAKIKENNFNTAIPVVANKVTSIVGDVLTHGGNVSIDVNSGIGQHETINYVDSATTLQEIINDTADGESANITLGGNIDLNDLLRAGTLSTRAGETAGLVIPANKTVVIDLKGYTISYSTDTWNKHMIENCGNLTLKGEGTVAFTFTGDADTTHGKGNYAIGIDEAAFYGPKLDIQCKNVFGKEDTIVTIQVDMLLAKKFGMEYVDRDNTMKTPYIIHRTSLGCYERTLALILEKYAGALPLWLAPTQVVVIPVVADFADYAAEVTKKLQAAGVRAELDDRNEKLGYRIREAQVTKVPYMVVVGEDEMNTGSVTVRARVEGEGGKVSVDEFVAKLVDEIETKKH